MKKVILSLLVMASINAFASGDGPGNSDLPAPMPFKLPAIPNYGDFSGQFHCMNYDGSIKIDGPFRAMSIDNGEGWSRNPLVAGANVTITGKIWDSPESEAGIVPFRGAIIANFKGGYDPKHPDEGMAFNGALTVDLSSSQFHVKGTIVKGSGSTLNLTKVDKDGKEVLNVDLDCSMSTYKNTKSQQ